jgi:hypothetical protein
MLKKRGVAETIPVLAQRAVADSPRWTRAVGIILEPPLKAIDTPALPGTRRVSARQGWVGEKSGHFEQPAGYSDTIPCVIS